MDIVGIIIYLVLTYLAGWFIMRVTLDDTETRGDLMVASLAWLAAPIWVPIVILMWSLSQILFLGVRVR